MAKVAEAGKKDEVTTLKKPRLLTISEFAQEFDFAPSTLYQKLDAGILEYKVSGGKRFLDVEKSLAILKATINPLKSKSKGVSEQKTNLIDAKAEREKYTAKQKKMEYEMLAGQLIDRKKVEKAAFECARITREQFMGIPDRLAADLAAEPDTRKIHTILTNAIHEALNALSERLTDFDTDGGEDDGDDSESFAESAGDSSEDDEDIED